MTPETFRAPTVSDAMEAVQRKLGPGALIVSVRQVTDGPVWQVWRSPQYEVIAMGATASQNGAEVQRQIAASMPTPTPSVPPAAPAPVTPQAPAAPQPSPTRELLQQLLARAEAQAAEASQTPPAALGTLRAALLAQGLDEGLTKKLLRASAEPFSRREPDDLAWLQAYIAAQLQAEIRTRPESSLLTDRVVCLVGSAGAGKTTTAAKIAATLLQRPDWHARKLVWVCADTISAGAVAEARQFTDALGIPLRVAYTPGELAALVANESGADFVLVDMPACNPYQERSVVEVGEFLTALPQRATTLVAPATSKDADLQQALAVFKPFNLKNLVLTRLDETRTYGGVYNLAWRSQTPLLYFSLGPRIPNDLQPAHTSALVDALMGKDWSLR
jgi:flagellar biosynthesis protein FlhF